MSDIKLVGPACIEIVASNKKENGLPKMFPRLSDGTLPRCSKVDVSVTHEGFSEVTITFLVDGKTVKFAGDA